MKVKITTVKVSFLYDCPSNRLSANISEMYKSPAIVAGLFMSMVAVREENFFLNEKRVLKVQVADKVADKFKKQKRPS